MTLTAQVTGDASGLGRVYVRYAYRNQNTGTGSNFMERDLADLGGGRYSVMIDVAAEASALLNGADGVFTYQIMAGDGQNNTQVYPDTNQPGGGHPLGIEIKRCGTAVGQPPSAAQLPVGQPQAWPGAVYYGACANGEETMTQLQVTIDPLDQVASAVVRYDYEQGTAIVGAYNYSQSMYQLGMAIMPPICRLAATWTPAAG